MRTLCPACHVGGKCGPELLGKAVRCPRCNTHFTVTQDPLDTNPKPTMPVECPYCHKRHGLGVELAGRNVVCGGCQNQMVVPYPVVGGNGAVQVATKVPGSARFQKVNHKMWAVLSLFTCGFALPFWALNWMLANTVNHDLLKHQRQ